MLAHTESVTLEAPFAVAFAYLSNPEHLPEWASVYCDHIVRDGSGWAAQTVIGQVGVRYDCNSANGTVDIVSIMAPGVESIAYTRLIPNGTGSEFIFTFVRSNEMSDEVFDSQRWGLREELRNLRAIARQLQQ